MKPTSRRTVLQAGAAFGAAAMFWPYRSGAIAGCSQPSLAAAEAPRPERAVSLRSLLESKPNPDARLPGLTRIDGYVNVRDDLILWGLAEPDQPELYLGDFALAIKLAMYRPIAAMIGMEGFDHKVPAISIDPIPENMKKTNDIPADRSVKSKKRYAELCSLPQKVRVDGMPRNSRIAAVLVEADYRMKKVSQSNAELPISPPLPGTYDAVLKARQAGDLTGIGLRDTRYWFQAGEYNYQKSGGTVFLDKARVELRTEDQIFGTDTASGSVDAASEAFACAWTARIEEIEKSEPIWRDMSNIYRHFAIAQAYKQEISEGWNLSDNLWELIRSYEGAESSVPDTLPGLSKWDIFQVRNARGKVEGSFISRVCGGVKVGFTRNIARSARAASETSWVSAAIARSRPEPTAISWKIGPLSEPTAAERGLSLAPLKPSTSRVNLGQSNQTSTAATTTASSSTSHSGGDIDPRLLIPGFGIAAIILWKAISALAQEKTDT